MLAAGAGSKSWKRWPPVFPVVSTVLGAEGLQVKHRENILISNSNEELASTIINLMNEPDLRAQIVFGGRQIGGGSL
jgi:hypothetical protein